MACAMVCVGMPECMPSKPHGLCCDMYGHACVCACKALWLIPCAGMPECVHLEPHSRLMPCEGTGAQIRAKPLVLVTPIDSKEHAFVQALQAAERFGLTCHG